MDDKFFCDWLSRQPEATILSNQVDVVVNILDRLDSSDLIRVMFYGKGLLALEALEILKKRYEEEQYWVNESNRTQYPGEEDATDWG